MIRSTFFLCGILALLAGAVGIVLPLLPTVPFVLLAAYCFARSSPVLERRILEHKEFGPHIVAWCNRGAINRRAKQAALVVFAISIVLGFWFLTLPWSLVPAGAALVAGSWLLSRPDADGLAVDQSRRCGKG